jgi:hypothetical protein
VILGGRRSRRVGEREGGTVLYLSEISTTVYTKPGSIHTRNGQREIDQHMSGGSLLFMPSSKLSIPACHWSCSYFLIFFYFSAAHMNRDAPAAAPVWTVGASAYPLRISRLPAQAPHSATGWKSATTSARCNTDLVPETAGKSLSSDTFHR